MKESKNLALAAAALLSMSAPCLAVDYRAEVQGTYSQLQSPADFPDLDAFWLQGRWFFAPVTTDGVPLAEAAFLGRASYVGALAARHEASFGNSVFETHSQVASAGYYIPGTMFFAGVAAARNQHVTGVSSTIVQKEYDTSWSGTVGIAPMDGLLITTTFREQGYDPNITARHVGKLTNSNYYAASVSLIDPDGGDTTFGAAFDYYFDESFSAGLAYDDARESLTGRVRKFFTPRFSLGGSYTNDDFIDSFNFDIAWRF